MADTALRRLERRFQASGDPAAELAWLKSGSASASSSSGRPEADGYGHMGDLPKLVAAARTEE